MWLRFPYIFALKSRVIMVFRNFLTNLREGRFLAHRFYRKPIICIGNAAI
jgi:hypothetical protein